MREAAGTAGRAARRASLLGIGALLALGVLLIEPPRVDSRTVLVGPRDDLQSAIDAARPGDVIMLQAGATYVGNFVLPARDPSDARPITMRSSVGDDEAPGANERVTPAHAHLLPKLRSPNEQAALRTAPGARGWRLVLLEFLPSPGGAGDIIRLGDGSAGQSDLAAVPHDLTIDRCYIHGEPDAPQKRGIALNSGETRITNSWISEIKARGQDSQAIGGWNGPGPYFIVNNRLEAAAEGFMLGGAVPAIQGLVPADVFFSGNHVTRPESWRGGPWTIKNLFELKNARRVRIEGNVFEYNWLHAQTGFAILFTPRSEDGKAPWAQVEDVTFRHNLVRHVSAGMNLLGRDSPNASLVTRNVEISHNLFYDVNGRTWGGNGEFLRVGDGVEGLVVEHNTVSHTGNIVSVYGGTAADPMPVRGFVFRFNILRHNAYGVHGSGRGVGNQAIEAYFPGAVFTDNVLAGAQGSNYPPGNSFPSEDEFDRLFVNVDEGDFRLVRERGRTGAVVPGADIDEVMRAARAAIAGVRSRTDRVPPERKAIPRIDRRER